MALAPATTIAEMRETCSPKPLVDGALDTFFVETGDARNDEGSIREELRSILDTSRGIRRILVCGHRGCGKSTELNRLKQELGPEWFTVSFSIHEFLPPIDVKAEDILLSLAIAIFEKAAQADPPLPLDERLLESVHEFFAEVTEKEAVERVAQLTGGAGAGIPGGGILATLLGLNAYLKAELSAGSKKERGVVFHIRRRPSELSAAINVLIEALRLALEARSQKLLLTVEDMDKLSLADAHDVFVRNGLLLSRPATNILYTIPIFTFYSPDAQALHAQFDDVVTLPMLKVVDLRGEKAVGYEVVREIIRRRIADGILDPDALDLLIRGTGGVLRDVFDVLQTVAGYRTVRDGHIHRSHIERALDALSIDIGVRIGWPLDEKGQRNSPADLYERLAGIAREQAEKKRVRPQNDPMLQVLLQSGALIEYNGERWLGVHPMARKYLAGLGHEVGPDPYGL